jgi:hypothetical protein
LQEFETSKRYKIRHTLGTTAEEETGDEILSWSGPKQPERSPLIFDKPVHVIEPVMRVPRRAVKADAHQKKMAQESSVEETKQQSRVSTAIVQKSSKQQEGGEKESRVPAEGVHTSASHAFLGNNKRKFSSIANEDSDRAVPSSSKKAEEEMIMWSGPKQPPRSPVKIDKPIFVTQPKFKQPRRSYQRSSEGGSGDASHSGKEDSGGGSLGGTIQRVPDLSKNEVPDVAEKFISVKEKVQNKSISKHNPVRRPVNNQESTGAERDTEPHSDNRSSNSSSTNHMPARDPKCHTQIVTPPCPINIAQTETPTPLRSYKHVSILFY